MITQGEWIYKQNTDGSWVVMSGNIVIAVLNREDCPEWNEDNAVLIAAAPDLLAACEESWRYLEGLSSALCPLSIGDYKRECKKAEKVLNAAVELAKNPKGQDD